MCLCYVLSVEIASGKKEEEEEGGGGTFEEDDSSSDENSAAVAQSLFSGSDSGVSEVSTKHFLV